MMRTRPGRMKAAPPSRAPRTPRRRQAQKIAIWVEPGPGSRLVAAIASSNCSALSQPRRVTQRSRKRATCAGGPPKPIAPIRPHSFTTSASFGAAGATEGDDDSPRTRRRLLRRSVTLTKPAHRLDLRCRRPRIDLATALVYGISASGLAGHLYPDGFQPSQMFKTFRSSCRTAPAGASDVQPLRSGR